MSCPADDELAELLAGPTGEPERAALLAHLDACESCRQLVADAVAVVGEPGDALGRGDVLGRYVIDRVLGGGAHGVVYAARDPQLARDVALKVLRAAGAERSAALREARTVARLAHPNVIAIYDVTDADAGLVIAMERVDGGTLRSWLGARPRGWAELRAVCVQAARGLAAAHAAGVVHRDIKPDNLLVGRDGRLRVSDFGLAIAPNTPTAAIAGTPAYMAPEQLAGGAVDERSDVFALCVVMFEALYERRPSAGEPVPATRRDVPGAVRAQLAAGLSADPARRPTLDELIHAMAPRRRAAIAAAIVVGALAGAAVVAAIALHYSAVEPCAGEAAAWPAVWTDRDGVRAAFAATGVAGATDAFDATDHELAAYRTRWIAIRRDSCLATKRGTQSPALLDRRVACLDVRHREAAALASLLAAPDRALIAGAVDQVRRLTPPVSCTGSGPADIEPIPAEPAKRSRYDELDAAAAQARAEQEAGHSAACAATIAKVIDGAKDLGYAPLLARLYYTRARCEVGDAAVVDDLQAAAAAATAGRDDETLAWAWSRLLYVAGWLHRDPAQAAVWERYTRAVLARGTIANPRVELGFDTNLALTLQAQSRMDEARAVTERRRALVIATEGAQSPLLAGVEEAIAITYLDEWRFAEALDHLHTAFALLDPHASLVARLNLLENETSALRGLGRAREAFDRFPQIFALLAERDPDGDDSYARARYGDALRETGDPAAALVEHRRALATCERIAGARGVRCADSHECAARDLIALGRLDEAAEELDRAQELADGTPGEPDLAFLRAQTLESRDPARSAELAATAAAALRELVDHHHANRRRLDEIEAWQRAHHLAP